MDESLRDSLEDGPDPNQGRIVTQNAALLAMLRENSMEKPLRRVYVDSPVISETDDDKYRYVSTNVDDFDQEQELALQDAESARKGPQYNYKDNIAFKQRQASRESIRHTDTGALDGVRYEDRNMRRSSYSADKEDLVPETQYVVRAKSYGSRQGSGSSKLSHRSNPQMIQPIQSPLKHRSTMEEEEDLELLQEAEYQRHLRDKIAEQTQAAENIHIPKLDLVDSDDEKAPRDSLEFNGGRIGSEGSDEPRDSLDDTDAMPYTENMDYGQGEPQGFQGNPVHNQSDPGKDYSTEQMQSSMNFPNQFNNPMQGQQLQQNMALQNQQQNQLLQQQQLQLLQQQMLQQGLLQQPLMLPQSSYMLVQNPQMMQFQQPQLVQQPYVLQQPLIYQQEQDMMHQFSQSGQPKQQPRLSQNAEEQDQQGFQQDQQEPDENAYYQQYEQEMQQNLAEQEAYEEETEHDGTYRLEDSDRKIARSVPQDDRPSVNYVDLNKKQLKKEQNKGSYGQKFVKRKTEKNTNAAPTPMPRKTVAAKPPVPQKTSSTGPVEEDASEEETNAEQVWAARSRTLTQQKVDKLNSGNRKPKPGSIYRGPLKKYPSESKVDDMKQLHGVPPGFKPHYVPAMGSPGHGGSMAEPIRSEIVVDPFQAPRDTPIRHTVVTEDGQRVSVDINLKLISPPPPHKVLAPLAPQNQQLQSQRPIQKPGQRPFQAFQNYEEAEEYREYMSSSPYKSPTPVASPYRVLPPIGSADSSQGREPAQSHSMPPRRPKQEPGAHLYESPRGENQGSYMEQFQKQKNKNHDYKTYTLEDYRKMKKEVRLGGLGPDMDSDTLRERKEKLYRQQEYARQANERNKQMPRKPHQAMEEPLESDDMLHRRKVALEYAKSVPKPKIGKPKPAVMATTQSAPTRNNQYSPPKAPQQERQESRKALQVVSAGTEREMELIDLQKLQERHEKERQQVAIIKQNMQQPV